MKKAGSWYISKAVAYILLLGQNLYKDINIEAYLKQAESTHGWFEFWANLKADHPVPVRRITALYDIDKQRIL